MRPLSPTRWNARDDLVAYLARQQPRGLLLGQDAQSPRAFHAFSLTPWGLTGEIGVLSSGRGTDPVAVVFEGGRRALVGHDARVTWVDVATLETTASLDLGGTVFEMLPTNAPTEVIVLHEIGLVRVNAAGATLWSIDTDIIEGWSADAAGNLVVRQMDAPTLEVDVDSGVARRR